MTRLQADLILLFSAAVWGLAFVFQKTAMDHIGPSTFIAARAGLAAVALLPLAVVEARGRPRPDWQGLGRIAVAGGVGFYLGAVFQQYGLVTATVTNTGFLTGLYVILTPVLAWAVLGVRPTPVVVPAVLLAFVGAWALGGGTLGGFSQGDMLVAICAVFWAAHMLIVGQSARHGRPVAFTAIQFAVVALLGLAGAIATEAPSLGSLWAALPQIAYVGLLSSALTFTLLAMAMRHTPASEAAVLVSMETLFAALAGALLMGDQLGVVGWIGAGLMFAASLLVQVWPRR